MQDRVTTSILLRISNLNKRWEVSQDVFTVLFFYMKVRVKEQRLQNFLITTEKWDTRQGYKITCSGIYQRVIGGSRSRVAFNDAFKAWYPYIVACILLWIINHINLVMLRENSTFLKIETFPWERASWVRRKSKFIFYPPRKIGLCTFLLCHSKFKVILREKRATSSRI